MKIINGIKELLDKTSETGKKAVETVKENVTTKQMKTEIGKTISQGIKNLTVFAERYQSGIVNEVVKALINDLASRKKAVEKLSLDALKIDIVDLMTPINNQKKSTAENESTRKLENDELAKVYNIATTTYQILSSQINDLIAELEKHTDGKTNVTDSENES